jgi:hypothetical protein
VKNIDVLIEGYLDWKDPQDPVELAIEVHIDYKVLDDTAEKVIEKRAKDLIGKWGKNIDQLRDKRMMGHSITVFTVTTDRGKVSGLKKALWDLEEKVDNTVEFIVKGK